MNIHSQLIPMNKTYQCNHNVYQCSYIYNTCGAPHNLAYKPFFDTSAPYYYLHTDTAEIFHIIVTDNKCYTQNHKQILL